MLHRMPTPNPRLSVTLKPSTAEVLKRLSTLTGNSQSSMVSELLESSEAVFVRMLQVLEAATKAQDAAKLEVQTGLEQAQTRLEEQLGIVMESFDDYTGNLLEGLEGVKRRRVKSPKATPLSNRGVRSTQPIENKRNTTNRRKAKNGTV